MSEVHAFDLEPARAIARRLLRRPKDVLLVILGLLVASGAQTRGAERVLAQMMAGIGGALVIDWPLLRWRKGCWVFPDGAIITGALVAMILALRTPGWQVAAAAALAVTSKHLLRARSANLFNPAALALAIAGVLWEPAQDWWCAAPGKGGVIVLVLLGVWMTVRVRKQPAVLAYLGIYFGLFATAAELGDARKFVEIFRSDDCHAALFLAFMMVTDPPTSPARDGDQLVYGAIAAAAAFTCFEANGAVYFLPAGLLVANGYAAIRRRR